MHQRNNSHDTPTTIPGQNIQQQQTYKIKTTQQNPHVYNQLLTIPIKAIHQLHIKQQFNTDESLESHDNHIQTTNVKDNKQHTQTRHRNKPRRYTIL